MASADPGDSGMLQSNDLWTVRAAVRSEPADAEGDPVVPVEPPVAEAAPPAEPAFEIDRQDVLVQLEFLRQAIGILEVPDPFGPEFAVATGAGEQLRPAAESWRAAASVLHPSMSLVSDQVSGIDGCWDGADSDAFVAQVRRIGARGGELAVAVTALADELDGVAESLRVLGREMRELIASVAGPVHAALREPDSDLPAAREHLMRIRRPAAGLAESVTETMAAFGRFCAEQEDALPSAPDLAAVSGSPLWTDFGTGTAAEPAPGDSADPTPAVTVAAQADEPAATIPAQADEPDTAVPAQADDPAATVSAQADDPDATNGADAVPAAGPAAAATGGAMAGGGMVGGMMPMAGMAGAGAGGGQRRPKRPRAKADPSELFGTPAPAAEPVLGDTKKKQQEKHP
ncbi:WXG100 family type VII secretion target [Saccharopolyspora sp. NPDC002578]